jgi:hypothetical protein
LNFAGRARRKRTTLMTKIRRENCIGIDLGEKGWDSIGRIYRGQVNDQCRALVNTVLKLRVLFNFVND